MRNLNIFFDNYRTVYEKVCAHGGYSPHSYSHIAKGYHKREAEADPEADSDADPEAREGKSYGYPGSPAHLGYGLVPAPYGLHPGPIPGHAPHAKGFYHKSKN